MSASYCNDSFTIDLTTVTKTSNRNLIYKILLEFSVMDLSLLVTAPLQDSYVKYQCLRLCPTSSCTSSKTLYSTCEWIDGEICCLFHRGTLSRGDLYR